METTSMLIGFLRNQMKQMNEPDESDDLCSLMYERNFLIEFFIYLVMIPHKRLNFVIEVRIDC